MRNQHCSLYCFLTIITAFTSLLFCPAFADNTAVTAIEKLDPNMAVADPDGEWLWYDAQHLTIEGKGWADTESF